MLRIGDGLLDLDEECHQLLSPGLLLSLFGERKTSFCRKKFCQFLDGLALFFGHNEGVNLV